MAKVETTTQARPVDFVVDTTQLFANPQEQALITKKINRLGLTSQEYNLILLNASGLHYPQLAGYLGSSKKGLEHNYATIEQKMLVPNRLNLAIKTVHQGLMPQSFWEQPMFQNTALIDTLSSTQYRLLEFKSQGLSRPKTAKYMQPIYHRLGVDNTISAVMLFLKHKQESTSAKFSVDQLLKDFLNKNYDYYYDKNTPLPNFLGFTNPPSLTAAAAIVSHLTQQSFGQILDQARQASHDFSIRIPGEHLPQILVDQTVSHTLSPDPAFGLRQLITNNHLSPNEFTYLILFARGLTYKQIAPMLNLAPKTTRNFLYYTRKIRLHPDAANKSQLLASPSLKALIEPRLFPQLQPARIRLLTLHQLEILSSLTRQTKLELAQSSGIKHKSVRQHVGFILQKLDCPNQAAAVTTFLLAQKQGLV